MISQLNSYYQRFPYLIANHCEYRIHSLDEYPRPDPRPPTRRGSWLQSAAPETGPSSVRARRPSEGDMTGMVEIPVQRLQQEEQEMLRAQEVERQRVRR